MWIYTLIKPKIHTNVKLHQCYFSKINFSYQPTICNSCNDLLQKSTSFDYIIVATIRANDYNIHFWFITKSNAKNRMGNVDLSKKQ